MPALAPAWVVRSRHRSLDADIWDILKRKERSQSILETKAASHRRTRSGRGRDSAFTCDELHAALSKISLEIEAGVRQKPTRSALKKELASMLGIGNPQTINAVLWQGKGRCEQHRSMYDAISYSDAHGFSREESEAARARLAKERTRFTCDELEHIMRTVKDQNLETITAALSKSKGFDIPTGTVFSAMRKRCKHLLPLWSRRGKRGSQK